MFKTLPLKDWLIFCEKFGIPPVIGKTQAPKGSAEWDTMVSAVGNFMNDWAAVISLSSEIEFPQVGGSGDRPFAPLVDRMDRVLSSMWRGGDLSSMSATAQDAGQGASVQGGESDLLEEDDVETICETLNKQVVPWVIKYAVGDDVPLARVDIPLSSRSDNSAELEVDKVFKDLGIPQAVKDLRERYGRRAPDEGDEVVGGGDRETVDGGQEAVDEELANVAGGDHYKKQNRDKRGRFGATFVSPNTGEDMPIGEAVRRGDSSEQGRAKSLASDIDAQLGLNGSHHTAFGDWADGAENTVYGEYSGTRDFDEVEYAAAVRGMLHDQKAVIAFRAEKSGKDALYIVSETNLTIPEARDILQANGFDNRTLIPRAGGKLDIVVFDKGGELESHITRLANETQTDIQKIRGRGEFIGDPEWTSRPKARGVYRGIIRRYEEKWPDRGHYRSGGGGRLRRGQRTNSESSLGNESLNLFERFGKWLAAKFGGGSDDGDDAGDSRIPPELEFEQAALEQLETARREDLAMLGEGISLALEAETPERMRDFLRSLDERLPAISAHTPAQEEAWGAVMTSALVNGWAEAIPEKDHNHED